VQKIFCGEKQYEYRKLIFRRTDIDKIIIYATKPIGKILGEVDIENILYNNPEKLWEITKEGSGISYNIFKRYFSKKEKGFAIKIRNAKLYSLPLEISDLLPNGVAPQSFCYLY
jgi:predicted transcriptional regulator